MSVQTRENAISNKSFLRWAGSKRQLLPILDKYFPKSNDNIRYVEPFAGSAALFFKIRPTSALLSDLNSQLVNALRQVRNNPRSVHKALFELPKSKDEYYSVRSAFNFNKMSDKDRAAHFIYLNRNCFNGLWRTDTKGRFNVPYGGDKSGNYPSLEQFILCSETLKRAKLSSCDFRTTLLKASDAPSFVYLDPPYFSNKRRIFVEYGKKTFDANDLDDLLAYLPRLDKAGARFVFTYRDSRYVRDQCGRWHIRRHTVMRNVGGFVSSRKLQREMIISNFLPGD